MLPEDDDPAPKMGSGAHVSGCNVGPETTMCDIRRVAGDTILDAVGRDGHANWGRASPRADRKQRCAGGTAGLLLTTTALGCGGLCV